ncbi:MAG TPA: tripartite tricarboxylate transporter substrate binding protein [Microvirga sp.]|jgi:tripartite-type tricarboxylate transporter receptor subunit TctC|nr:tripartite tricarboxylate transporter substrate binding protein [Microvirga sp.]
MLLAALASFGAEPASATQACPDKPIRLVVGFPAGGGIDLLARTISDPLSKRLKQKIVIENKPGATGAIAAEQVAKAANDGCTLMMGNIGQLAINPSLEEKLAYDPVKSFEPIGLVASLEFVAVVPADSPIKTLKDLVERAQAQPGRLNYASGARGGVNHLSTELFAQVAKINVRTVSYKGSNFATLGLLGGEVDFMIEATAIVLPHIKSGKLRPLASATKDRQANLPDVPTFTELGFPQMTVGGWGGLLAPAGIKKDLVSHLNTELNAVLKQPDVAGAFASQGLLVEPGTPEDFGTLIGSELQRWNEVVRAAGKI